MGLRTLVLGYKGMVGSAIVRQLSNGQTQHCYWHAS